MIPQWLRFKQGAGSMVAVAVVAMAIVTRSTMLIGIMAALYQAMRVCL